MIRKRTAIRLGAVAAIGTIGLSLGAGVAMASTNYYASARGCNGGMQVERRSDGHDWVRGFVSSGSGNSCGVTLHQSNGNTLNAGTGDVTVYTDWLIDAGITSYATVCNLDLGGCASTVSY
ncbi:hypothetical protein ACFQ6N_36385 [Kitasatospora sp. NPDC056446]|uniref:hypothetical protein n=1 Tax=Kitasatospora sp. NPDC056446 TaxID=3345819 RepID=UPI00369D378E